MSLTNLQKRAAQAIVNIYETGEVLGDYGAVTVLPGYSGHLTYGRAQTTLGSGNLYKLIKAYCDASGAALAGDLRPYLTRLRNKDTSLDHDTELHATLEGAGEDPVMRETQDAFFDTGYWDPAIASSQQLGIASALGTAVVYDSKVHGSWGLIRDRVLDNHGSVGQLGEARWINAYVRERRAWLADHPNPVLRRTVYRMDEFRKLTDAANWPLGVPFTVRGKRIDQASLGAKPERRTLRLTEPRMRGPDVVDLQQALANAGWAINIDGVFGPGSERCVRQFQEEEGLNVDGVVGPGTWAALGFTD